MNPGARTSCCPGIWGSSIDPELSCSSTARTVPTFSAAIEEGGFEDGSPEGEAAGDDGFDFSFSLGLLLDGIETLVQRSGHQRGGTDVVDDQVGDQPAP